MRRDAPEYILAYVPAESSVSHCAVDILTAVRDEIQQGFIHLKADLADYCRTLTGAGNREAADGASPPELPSAPGVSHPSVDRFAEVADEAARAAAARRRGGHEETTEEPAAANACRQ